MVYILMYIYICMLYKPLSKFQNSSILLLSSTIKYNSDAACYNRCLNVAKLAPASQAQLTESTFSLNQHPNGKTVMLLVEQNLQLLSNKLLARQLLKVRNIYQIKTTYICVCLNVFLLYACNIYIKYKFTNYE